MKKTKVKIAVIGEYKNDFESHIALNRALNELSNSIKIEIYYQWIETTVLLNHVHQKLSSYHGIWSAPGSPFKSLQGAVNAVTYARTNKVPHLGTCAGFQHTVIAIARDLLGYKEAQHEEYDHAASQLFINRLVCSLAGKTLKISIKEGTEAARCYNANKVEENYYCNFGINPEYSDKFIHPKMVFSGLDLDGEVRIIELKDHPFFVSTLFVPQMKKLKGAPHPLVKGFITAALKYSQKERE